MPTCHRAKARGCGLWSSPHVAVLEEFGGRSRDRTYDPLIKSQLLYQLSYAPAFAEVGRSPSKEAVA
jgi:hypothetical protein